MDHLPYVSELPMTTSGNKLESAYHFCKKVFIKAVYHQIQTPPLQQFFKIIVQKKLECRRIMYKNQKRE